MFDILAEISRNPEITQRTLAKLCKISIGKVNYTINKLIEENFIETKKTGSTIHYFVSEKGKEYLIKELEKLQETKVSLYKNEYKPITQAVILAAGERKSFDRPIGLLDIHGTTLLERTVNILEENGIEKIVIVTGYLKEMLEQSEVLKGKDTVSFVENTRYLWTGSMASLALASDYMTDDFILIEDDILIEQAAIEELLETGERDCILMTKESGSGDEAFVEIRNDQIYQISKDIHRLNRIDGEMVGITKISYEVYQEMLNIFKDNQNPYINYEYTLLDVGRTVNLGFLKLPNIIWAEVDNYADYFKVVDKIFPLLRVKEEEIKVNEIKQTIANALQIDESLITTIESLGGLTNRNYKITIDGKDYAVRFPGKGTEKFLNRSTEKLISETVSELGINPPILFFDEHTGLKIVEYIPEAETLNPKTGKREENLIMIADIFRKLHDSEVDFKDRFDVFEKITEYEDVIASGNVTLPEDYSDLKAQVLELENQYLSMNVPLSPCHIDPLSENFVKSGANKMYLIDWEYGGMNDAFWDIAAFIIESELSPAEERLFVLQYFNGEMDTITAKRLLMNKIFVDFLWTLWGLMKVATGYDFYSYAMGRFNRTKGFMKEYQLLEQKANV
ncbi:NTP transferase domain-containing protein [Bacillus sp. JJ1566]|uniref:NTP transferase domain-containing protein n=1 Tax=Bacillus sp. JJ1566 TaxID=3122961 RepID=UPI0030001A13